MGLLNKLWSGADFWDKQENAKQRDQFKAQDDERKKREAEARAQKQAQQAQKDAKQPTQTNVPVPVTPNNKLIIPGLTVPPQPNTNIQQIFKPLDQPIPVPQPAPVKLNKFGNP
jgi:hypothetical protein